MPTIITLDDGKSAGELVDTKLGKLQRRHGNETQVNSERRHILSALAVTCSSIIKPIY